VVNLCKTGDFNVAVLLYVYMQKTGSLSAHEQHPFTKTMSDKAVPSANQNRID
jgi:hypothetical protein